VEDAVLKELNLPDDPRWDEFVSHHPQGTLYHRSAWGRVLRQTYGYTPFSLGLFSADGLQLQGGLLLMLVRSPFTGRRLVSLPFTGYCNPLVPEARLEEMMHFAYDRFPGIDYVELKFLDSGSPDAKRDLVATPFVNHALRLKRDIGELFQSFHNTCVRQRVRRAEREGLTPRMGAATESRLRDFYRLYTGVRRHHGLPPQPYAFFANMHRILTPEGLFELPVIEYEGRAIAAAVLLKSRSVWHLEYSASDARFLKHGPNQLLIWECIKKAHQNGAEFFDFGRTSLWHRQLLEFKERWGAEGKPISHRYLPSGATARSFRNPSSGLLAQINRRLPAFLLEWEGRLLYRHMG